VNSIQAIDALDTDSDRGQIRIVILREPSLLDAIPVGPGRIPQQPIVGFRVEDGGIGFDDKNMKSFETLDSQFKADQGCRGVGRLLWLKAFETVAITSVYRDGAQFFRRSFRFSATAGVQDEVVSQVTDSTATGATVELTGFRPDYRQQSAKLGETVAKSLLEHCLWYFVRTGGAPPIQVIDGGSVYHLDEVYEDYIQSGAEVARFDLGGYSFDLIHLKLTPQSNAIPHLNWCAANRVALEEPLAGRIPGLYATLGVEARQFSYAGYLLSPYLDDRVRSERTGFDLQESIERHSEDVLDVDVPPELSMHEIREQALREISRFLADALAASVEAGRQRVEDFVSHHAPRYRPILRLIDERQVGIDAGLNDKELELELHKHLTSLDAEILREGQEVLGQSALKTKGDDYQERLDAYLTKVEEIKQSDLIAYVSRRRLVLDLLAEAIEWDGDGKYVREDRIHNMLMPMRTTSDDEQRQSVNNLWIIDERLAFHNYLASDKTVRSMPITGSESLKKPDLLALQTNPEPLLLAEGKGPRWASISLIEIKRPMRDDAGPGEDRDPIAQCLRYLRLVREGGVKTATGRPISNAASIPGFCYIIADLTPTLKEQALFHQLAPTEDDLGFFGYHSPYNAYIEVVSFDRLVSVARQRNRAFFDIAGLPV